LSTLLPEKQVPRGREYAVATRRQVSLTLTRKDCPISYPSFITPTESPTTVSSTGTRASSNPSVTFLSINPSATYLGPLTTVFTPPKSCFETVTQWWITENVIFHGISGDPNCYSGDVRVLSQTFEGYYYSPGVCPSGFIEAGQDRVQWPAAAVAITASLCCPR
jgi:hypothetical protein